MGSIYRGVGGRRGTTQQIFKTMSYLDIFLRMHPKFSMGGGGSSQSMNFFLLLHPKIQWNFFHGGIFSSPWILYWIYSTKRTGFELKLIDHFYFSLYTFILSLSCTSLTAAIFFASFVCRLWAKNTVKTWLRQMIFNSGAKIFAWKSYKIPF